MHSPETVALFRRLLEQQIACAEGLCQALAREGTALGSGTPEHVEEAATAKQELLAQMEQRLAAYEGFLAARRLPSGRRGSELFLAQLPAKAPERALWERLRELARQCREQNEVNGSLVAMCRTRAERALELLRGPGERLRTYGRAGTTRGASIPHLIGRV
jgi:flagellar biosynthesis/type III secretory pathway chaperone